MNQKEGKNFIKSGDKDGDGVNDTIERLGEMLMAWVGMGFAVYGRSVDIISEDWCGYILIASFALYQSTSMLKIFKELRK